MPYANLCISRLTYQTAISYALFFLLLKFLNKRIIVNLIKAITIPNLGFLLLSNIETIRICFKYNPRLWKLSLSCWHGELIWHINSGQLQLYSYEAPICWAWQWARLAQTFIIETRRRKRNWQTVGDNCKWNIILIFYRHTQNFWGQCAESHIGLYIA